MPGPAIKIESHVQFLVEGKDDKGVLETLIKQLRLAAQVHPFDGVDHLRTFLPAFKDAPDFPGVTRLGIVRDAETNAAGAFQSVCGSLGQCGLATPESSGKLAGDDPAVGVMILPGNDCPGSLETLLCQTFAGSREDACIDDFLQCLQAAHCPVQRPDKARAHAFIATKEHPHVSVGVAAQKGYWDLRHPAFKPLRQFLRAVANVNPNAPQPGA